jgi:nucleoside-diphosphate-sugar epimerase
MRIYLTGGTGLLGSHFATLALAEGARVISLARPTSNTAYLEALSVPLSIGDLRDAESLVPGMQDCDAVVHAASPLGAWGSPQLYAENTVQGTRNVIAAMEIHAIKSLVYISSISVHGLDPLRGKPISEADGFGTEFLPYDHYGRAKVQAEQIVREAHDAGRIQATVLRPGWIYGPRGENSYGTRADMMRRGLAIKVGNGENRVALVYAGNIARAIWLALVKASPDYRVYLCARDGSITENDYFASLARATRASRGPISVPKDVLLGLGHLLERLSVASGYRIPVIPSRFVVHLLGSEAHFDQSRTGRELGYVPPIDCPEGFAATEAWYRASRSLP